MAAVRFELAAAFDRLRANDEDFTEFRFSSIAHLPRIIIIGEDAACLNVTEVNAFTAALIVNTHLDSMNLEAALPGRIPPDLLRPFLEVILQTHQSLQSLILPWNCLRDYNTTWVAEKMKTNTSLRVIDLSCNNNGPAGARGIAEMLPQNKTLEELNLSNNMIGVDGCKAIASVLDKISLKVLNLGDNGIENDGAEAISGGLVKNKSLTKLDLHENGIWLDGHYLSFFPALCRNSSLCELYLHHNEITAAGAAALEESLQHMNYSLEILFGLEDNEDVTLEQVDRIRRLCSKNILIKRAFARIQSLLPVLSLAVWPRALEHVREKPDLIYALLKSKPDLCRERHSSRRRGRSDAR